jgi:hypothetical protein
MLTKEAPKLQYANVSQTWIPGTTTVLGVLAKDALIKWAYNMGLKGQNYEDVRNESADIGKVAHYLIECDAKAEQPEIEVSFGEDNIKLGRSIFSCYLDWKIDNNFWVRSSEVPIANEFYGGTLDLIGSTNGDKPRIFDVKTSSGVYYSHLVQLGAYRRLYREHCGENLEATILHLPRRGGCKAIEFSEDELNVAEHTFSHCLQIYNNRKTLEEIMKSKGTRRRAKA